MPTKVDLSAVSPERAAHLLRQRESKKRTYQRRKDELLARTKAWRDANPEKAREAAATWKAAHPERVAESKRTWYEQNRDLQLSRAANRNRDLVDSVVKSNYCYAAKGCGLQSKDIPNDLVPAIRLSIQIRREIREQKRELRRTHN